jgi:C4-dicarboxylate-specific signal transduction histidine kinase
MARDLKHFQKTAIEVERTSQRLAAEIDERIIAEAQLKAAQNELIQAGKLAALGQLSVGITHEINQPLTAIASHLHTAGRRLDRQQPEQARLSLDRIRQLLDKIASITRHLKAFAREAGTALSPVELDAVIRETLELMSARLMDAGCELCYQPGPAGLRVKAEPIRLEQVLVNLLSNAIDAMKGGSIRTLNIRIGHEADAVRVEVQDSGPCLSSVRLKAADCCNTTGWAMCANSKMPPTALCWVSARVPWPGMKSRAAMRSAWLIMNGISSGKSSRRRRGNSMPPPSVLTCHARRCTAK